MKQFSLLEQVRQTIAFEPKTILYVGIEYDQVPKILKILGYNVTTLDIVNSPDVFGDVRQLPFKDKSFDVAVCCQVLEHLNYNDFIPSLSELKRVSKYLVVSLPDRGHFGLLSMLKLSLEELVHPFHMWEINVKGYPLSKIISDIKKSGINILKTYRLKEKPYHRFFIMRCSS
jgi:SAM-dependent methyltransferase